MAGRGSLAVARLLIEKGADVIALNKDQDTPTMVVEKLEDLGKLILRITTAGLILFHGTSKIIREVSFMGPALAQFHRM